MDNKVQLLLRIDSEVTSRCSDAEVVERWCKLFPPRGADRKAMKVSKEFVSARLENMAWVAEVRVEHAKSNGRTEDLQAAELGSVAAGRVSNGLEDDLWLVPQSRRTSRTSLQG